MSDFREDYMGFFYNGRHSSEFGIVRVSDGSRFNENLLPTAQDKTVPIPGRDGSYYFGSYYTQRQLSVSFAFDDMSEQQLEEFRKCLGDKKVHDLIFDERPYKIYSAKVTGSATIKYIPFDEGENNRVYKGEGTIQFTCYQPYAVCKKKFLDEYEDSNKNEWAAATGMLETKSYYDQLMVDSSQTKYSGFIATYNPGVKESDCIIRLATTAGGADNTKRYSKYTLSLNSGEASLSLNWGTKPAPKYLAVDSKNHLIKGSDGEIYNEYINGGDFFDIPLGESVINIQVFDQSGIQIDEVAASDVEISYNYYYY